MKFLNLLLLLVFLTGCGEKESNLATTTKDSSTGAKTITITDTIQYEIKNYKETYKGCKEEKENCASVKISYPYFKGEKSEEINKIIESYIVDSIYIIDERESNKDIKGLASNFLKDYEIFKTEVPESPASYELEINGSVLLNDKKIITAELSTYIFTGGAHPNSFSRYFIFDAQTGKRLKVNDIFITGFEEKLNKLIDKKYRKENNLSDKDKLNEGNGMLFENYIHFNDNIAILKDGVKFLYNKYEIAPYAVGEIEIKFNYSELSEILKPEFRR